MRVLYVWDAEYPWDVRTEKVCMALTHAGHQVVITARNLQARSRSEARPEGLVERLPSLPAPVARWGSFPAFFNPVWLSHVHRLVGRHAIDLIIVRDIPLAPTALLCARGRPVVLDMAENYPAMIQDVWTDGRQRRLDFLIRNPRLVGYIERQVIGRMAHILTVVEESSERLRRLGVPAERMTVVSNTPPLSRVGGERPAEPGGPLRLVYLGLMEHHRGVGCTLQAAAMLAKAGVAYHLDLVGDGRDLEEFRRQASSLGLTSAQVTFHGRLEHARAIALVAGAQVGLVPHEARESWNTTIPNKLFDYMAAGLTVITSDAVPAARVVRDTGAGLVFRSGDGAHLADQIRQTLDPESRRRYGRAGQDAVRSHYNWESDARALLNAVAAAARPAGLPGLAPVNPSNCGKVAP